MEIAFVARELARGNQVGTIKTLAGTHLEPTWGDLKKANMIVSGLSTSNRNQLLTAFGVGLAINDLQLCRNASAHLNTGTLAAVTGAKIRYSQTKLVHPSDMIFWVNPKSKDFVWKT